MSGIMSGVISSLTPKKMLCGVGFLLVLFMLTAGNARADDTEIFFARADAGNDQNELVANVLFLIDTSGSMCDPPDGGSRDCSRSDTKMYQLKEAFSAVVSGLSDKIRIGVGKFNGGHDRNGYGGYVFYPVSPMNAASRQDVIDTVDNLQGTSNTPTMEAYSEMARYMLGMSPTGYAKRGEANDNSPKPAVNLTWSCTDWDGNECDQHEWVSSALYDSPMDLQNQCETNHIIVMTDGDPTWDYDYDSVEDITGERCHGSYDCQKDLAAYLSSKDENGKRSIKTWQVAFGQGISHLDDMNAVARAGGTGYARTADNAEELAGEFLKILDLIDEASKSITAPGVSVNQANRLEYLDQLYYSVFTPAASSVWEGNLKRYRLDGSVIRDANGMDAVDSETGYFSELSQSWWSDEVDGYDATKGGARSQLANRRIFYNTSSGGMLQLLTPGTVNGSGFSASRFGIPAQDAEEAFDTKTEVYSALLTQWADPLHSVPLVVNYAGGDNPDASQQTNYVFVSTNGGMLHAIDADDGSEVFSFMPYQELRQAYDFVRSPGLLAGNTRMLYGMDGSWVAWRQAERNSDGSPTGDAEKVYIYAGMRRGGDSYFALDVSDINNPEMLWQIDGGYNSATPTTSGFDLLGQTFSTPTLAQVRINGTDTPVLVFGGGYDPEGHDTAGVRHGEDDYGRAVYMVDAETGELIWSASSGSNNVGAHTSVSHMNWSIPGGVATVDLDFDGYTDYLYFADLGGQIFRANLDNANSGASGLVEGVTRVADLGGSSTADQRRFYSAPSIGYAEDSSGKGVLYVTIGSGYRAHPLDEGTDERIYSIRDVGFREVGGDQYPITHSDLVEVGASSSQDSPPEYGWYHEFSRPGEKVLAPTTIDGGYVMFTTYAPTGQDQATSPCTVRYGEARVYIANMLTGNAPAQENGGSDEEGDDSNPIIDDIGWGGQELDQTTIPASVTVIYQEDGTEQSALVGTETIGDSGPGNPGLRRFRWYQMSGAEANDFIEAGQGQ